MNQKQISGTILPETNTLVVRNSNFLKNQLGVVTKKDFKKGELLFLVTGPIQKKRTKYSFAIDLDRNIEPVRNDGQSDFGHYLNHSCDPNTVIKIVENHKRPYIRVVARQKITKGEELTFDYASLEYDVTAKNIICRCGNKVCRGSIHGFKDLPKIIVEKYKKEGLIPNYLLNINAQKRKASTKKALAKV